MALIICKKYLIVIVNDSGLYSGGTDIDPKTEHLIHASGEDPPILLNLTAERIAPLCRKISYVYFI